MFTVKQTTLMNTLGIVSDKERMDTYMNYCEIECELRANGISTISFTQFLQATVDYELSKAKQEA